MIDKLVSKLFSKNPSIPIRYIKVPNKLVAGKIDELLENISFVFKLENKNEPNYVLLLQNVTKIDVIGMLIIYKLIEFTSSKNCFYRAEIKYNHDSYYSKSLDKYGFGSNLKQFIDNLNTNNFDVNITNNFIIAPQIIDRLNTSTHNNLNRILLPKIQEYYINDEKIINMISCCLSEIFLNFWEHAVIDTHTILAAEGKSKYIEIACTDTGNGIISTLREQSIYKDYSGIQLIEEAVKRGVTSKKGSNHMGYGLWLLNEIAKKVNGRFHLYSEGFCYKLDYGNILIKESSYWKGTIVYIALDLKKPVSLADIDSLKKYIKPNFEINYLN